MKESGKAQHEVDKANYEAVEGAACNLRKPRRRLLLFMMVSIITPLGSTVINVALCAAGGALFAFCLGAASR